MGAGASTHPDAVAAKERIEKLEATVASLTATVEKLGGAPAAGGGAGGAAGGMPPGMKYVLAGLDTLLGVKSPPNMGDYSSFGKALAVAASADGTYAPEEKSEILGLCKLMGFPNELLDQLAALAPSKDEDIVAIVKGIGGQTELVAKHLLWCAVTVCDADGEYSPGEKEAVKKIADALGVSAEDVAKIEETCLAERALTKERKQLIGLGAWTGDGSAPGEMPPGMQYVLAALDTLLGVKVPPNMGDYSAFGKALAVAASADGTYAPEEKAELVGLCKLMGFPDELLDMLDSYAPKADEDVVALVKGIGGQAELVAKHLIWCAITVCNADGEFTDGEKAAVAKMAGALSVSDEDRAAIETIVLKEFKLTNERKALIGLGAWKGSA